MSEPASLLPSPRARTRSSSSDGDSDSSPRSVEIMERVTILTNHNEEEDSGISETSLLEPEMARANGPRREKMVDIFVQVFIPFMIAGFGMMAAGLLLDAVQVCWLTWFAF